MKTTKILSLSVLAVSLFYGCGSTGEIISVPVENIDTSPIKISDLTKKEANHWGHLDLSKDTIPGMSVERAYQDIIKGKKGEKVIVAVIDSGIDIDHEDLDDVIWINTDEIPNNGIDDDKNGYIDDIHGWNFLGTAYDEQLEFVRILASGDTSNPDYARAKSEYDSQYQIWMERKTRYDQIHQQIKSANDAISKHLGKDNYTKEEVNAIKTDNESLKQAIQLANYMYSNGMEKLSDGLAEIEEGLVSINERLNYNLNKDFKGRKTGDNPDNFSQKGYGDGNVKHVKKSESHGTHVAGIIAAERNNGLGADGVANNVEIMCIRTVPNGDEYDKDVALSIRYAVDNGAKVINGSFGKSFSPHSDWVRDAIAYAAKKDVVFVHAAGNDSKNVDLELNFPDDNDPIAKGPEVSDTYIRVGALTSKYGSDMIAGFSNYGKKNVDVFAPGAKIYSTMPENEYKALSGTSMAAPGVAGVAALIRSYYPKLSAGQVKQIIMDSGLPLTTKVVVGGDSNNVKPFSELAKSGKIVNAYNALIMASKTK
ncbi:MAG: S8 family peptidase [Aestuariibaculum sp.]